MAISLREHRELMSGVIKTLHRGWTALERGALESVTAIPENCLPNETAVSSIRTAAQTLSSVVDYRESDARSLKGDRQALHSLERVSRILDQVSRCQDLGAEMSSAILAVRQTVDAATSARLRLAELMQDQSARNKRAKARVSQ